MTTTIKVSNELRDRLKALAATENLTLGEFLARLVDAEDRRRRLASLRAAIESTSADELASYRAETEAWERAELTDMRRAGS